MAQEVDARGLSCPQPVILAKGAIQAGDFPVIVLVETATSRDNVRRMAQNNGCDVTVEAMADDEFRLQIMQRP